MSSAETSFYTGGGSKDTRDIPAWQYGTTNDVIPDKDDIADAFAAAYTTWTTPETIIYFGMDRYDNNGDAEAGFWFFENPVSLGPNGTVQRHPTPGDVLVLANWGGSNPVGEITVYQWVGGKNPLALIFDSTRRLRQGRRQRQRLRGRQPRRSSTALGLPRQGRLPEHPAARAVRGRHQPDRAVRRGTLLRLVPGLHPVVALDDRSAQGLRPRHVRAVRRLDHDRARRDQRSRRDEHTFTVSVTQVTGGAPSPAPDGTIVDVDLTADDGAAVDLISNTCASPGTVDGECEVTFTSESAGTVSGHASATVVIGDDEFVVETDGEGENSGDAVKTFIDAAVSITPDDVNEIGEDHTFTVTATRISATATARSMSRTAPSSRWR